MRLYHPSFRKLHDLTITKTIIKFFTTKAGGVVLVSCLVVAMIVAATVIALRPQPPRQVTQPVKPAASTDTKVTNKSEPIATNSPIAETPQPQQSTAAPTSQPQTQSQPTNGNTTTPPHTSPPYIFATTRIGEYTKQDSPTCDFTTVVTASALYHDGQSPYASHVISFTLGLQASDGSASYSQTFTHTFAAGETKEFRLSGSFDKPDTETTYQITASGKMSILSGSASLGPNSAYNVIGYCGPRSPSP